VRLADELLTLLPLIKTRLRLLGYLSFCGLFNLATPNFSLQQWLKIAVSHCNPPFIWNRAQIVDEAAWTRELRHNDPHEPRRNHPKL